ncbi:MAG: CoB--CoM heterodisulfide reductase iron-sulfur subunit A family protein [Deltaproteobacteria bacterium]|nr:CoB--CoM heterodisulfide reductase iron-sulfur subunit A family protein [Deltaproteobacteria bacterium]MBW2073349.1 CoB--CoM heterodisulfide reductase iron-sulfur subunit A family protein [Deltaproteobacteria bacterium]RLB83208.1 MAG: heterodisulfide reductase [Deltaproteobacteria bacterium]
MEDNKNKIGTSVSSPDRIGAVMVVGGGIAGVQAALDLADLGFRVYLIEQGPAIGGKMAQLDKTFPTNDCSMCILSPKLIECQRNSNIEIVTFAEVKEIKGEAGQFKVSVLKKPRYIHEDLCTNCGQCSLYCPLLVPDPYNECMSGVRNLHIHFPQAIPAVPYIDPTKCLFLTEGVCHICTSACQRKAIDFGQQEVLLELDVGAVVLALGFEPFDPQVKATYGYGRFPNVLSSMEFERILSATGPFQGHVRRPSDGKEPEKIAWIQCVGSRDPSVGRGYCSSVCCMYAIKEAMLAKEHATHELDTTLFYIDIRSHGKDFEKFYNRAKEETGIRFVKSRIDTISQDDKTGGLFIYYTDENSRKVQEAFDMVVLSVGLGAPQQAEELSRRLGISLDHYGFAATTSFEPVNTSRSGIYVCGAFQGPKDIPQSVMEASASAGAASATLALARNTLTEEHTYPEEKNVDEEEPRIGVFICHCGINIGGVVNVPEVKEYARNLPHVAYVDENLFSCSQDTQSEIKQVIKEHNLNRFVVASCSPRTHEPLFRETLREAGLNQYLFEMANIRDQCSWVHMHEPEKATEKAKDLVRMAVAKAGLIQPLSEPTVPVTKAGLVIGGGVTGMTCALNLAEQGYEVHLVEREKILGGQARKLYETWKGEQIRSYLEDLVKKAYDHPRIHVYTQSEIKDVEGFVGNFESTVSGADGNEVVVKHGITIVATGAEAYRPSEYLYGHDPGVFLSLELDEAMAENRERFDKVETAVFIQCVGSREPERPYCSRVCCTHSIHSALKLKELNPDVDVYVLYRDIRTYGEREDIYREARSKGIAFIRYSLADKPRVEKQNGKLKVTVTDQVLQCPVEIEADILTLASAIVPSAGNEVLSKLYKISMNQEGFFLEAHVKLRPVDFATDGIYLAGLAHYPKPIEESIAQAQAASAKAAALLSQDSIVTQGVIARVNEVLCRGCSLCAELCPFEAIKVVETENGRKAQVIDVACKGCGVCAATCYRHAIGINAFTDEQIGSQVRAFLGQ